MCLFNCRGDGGKDRLIELCGEKGSGLQPTQFFPILPKHFWSLFVQQRHLRHEHGMMFLPNIRNLSYQNLTCLKFLMCISGWWRRTDPWVARCKLRNGHFAQRDPEAGREEKTSETTNEATRFKSRPCSSGISFHYKTSEWQF